MSTSPTAPSPFQPKAIVFDLLTALLDSWSVWDASTPSGTAADGRRWRARYLELTYGQGAYVAYSSLVRQSALDVGLPASTADALLSNWSQLAAWPETGAVLRRLRARGYRLGVVTNCSDTEGAAAVGAAERAAALSADGQPDPEWRFDAAVTAEQAGFYKPRREAYHAILPLLVGEEGRALRPEEVLFVAGSNGDVQGATDAGFRVVWHNKIGLPKKGEAEPLRESETLDDALRDFW